MDTTDTKTNRIDSSTDNVTSPDDDNYLDLINQSFSSNHDLSLPNRVISSPTLDHASPPAAKSQTQRGRILNNLFHRDRGSNDTLGGSSAKASSPIVSSHSPMPQHSTLSPTIQPSTLSNNSNRGGFPSTTSLQTAISGEEGASSSSLSTSLASPSPQPKKSILKQSNRSPMTNNNTPLSPVPKSTRSTTTQQQQPITDQLSYLPVDGVAAGTGVVEAAHASVPYQPPPVYPQQSAPYQQQQQQQQQQQSAPFQPYEPQPIAPYQQPMPAFYSYDSNNSDYLNNKRFSGGTPPSPHNATQLGGYQQSHSTDSTHRSSRNLSPAPEPNFNLTQTDATLEGLAQRWYAYQTVMKKSYAEDPFYKRWTGSKWLLLFSALLLLGYSAVILYTTLTYILQKAPKSSVVMEFHSNLVYLSLAGSVFGIASALVGLVGIFRENRIWLSYYTIVLWPGFALYVAVGYIAFRRAKQHLRAHIKDEWINEYTREQRLLVQHNLFCCGFQDSTNFAEYDMRCFPMTTLPDCEHKYSLFEKDLLTSLWTWSFTVAPLHLFVMVVALLCSNHVNNLLRSARPGLVSFRDKKQQ
ncbi:hypothetical protein BGZ47_001235 [Haplosporangium gracile]|nr:hypothetical protein BGZ47_001235 [Haplosporangium gracile]